jgi:hypothetical protein
LVVMPFALLEELVSGRRFSAAEHPVAHSPGPSR